MFESTRAERCDQRVIANEDGKKEWNYRWKKRVVLLGKKAKRQE
jgi:hypothetical protein